MFYEIGSLQRNLENKTLDFIKIQNRESSDFWIRSEILVYSFKFPAKIGTIYRKFKRQY